MPSREEQLRTGAPYPIPSDAASFMFIRKGAPGNYEMLGKGAFPKIESLASLPAYRLLIKLAEDMKPFSGNKIYVNFDAIAADMHLTSKEVYRVFKLFLNADFIRRVKKGHYLIDPEILYYGRTVDRAAAIEQWKKGVIE